MHETARDGLTVVAIVSVHDDEAYLDTCLRHMASQGVTACVIDNDANDATRAIVDRHRDGVVTRVERHPHPGYFDWQGILETKTRLAAELDADWLILWDTDEIRESRDGRTPLREALAEVDALGYDAVNFDEFVFLPVSEEESHEGRDYVREMQHYYHFSPGHPHRITAWKRTDAPIELVSSAGHEVRFPGRRLYPFHFVMRHYLFLSRAHGVAKYCTRSYSDADLARGWNRERSLLTPENLRLPDPATLSRVERPGEWRRDHPLHHHPCFPYPDEGP